MALESKAATRPDRLDDDGHEREFWKWILEPAADGVRGEVDPLQISKRAKVEQLNTPNRHHAGHPVGHDGG